MGPFCGNTQSLWKMLPTKDHKSRTAQPCHDSVSLVQLLLNSGLLMQCLRGTWPEYPFAEGCRNPRNDCPLEIHACLPPAMFTQQRCTRVVPHLTVELWEFSLMFSLSWSHVNWLWQTQMKGHPNILPLWVLFQSYKRHKYWPQEMSQWSPPKPGGQLPQWKFLYLHTSLCTAATSVRDTEKHQSRGCFLLEQL